MKHFEPCWQDLRNPEKSYATAWLIPSNQGDDTSFLISNNFTGIPVKHHQLRELLTQLQILIFLNCCFYVI